MYMRDFQESQAYCSTQFQRSDNPISVSHDLLVKDINM